MSHLTASYSGPSVSVSSSQRKPTTTDEFSVQEHGRTFNTYSGENKYFLPNDGEEQDRLDAQHELWLLLLGGKLALAPLFTEQDDHPQGLDVDVLDIGTGTGIWAWQFARQHPRARVVGTDLSLIQHARGEEDPVPPNCTFVQEDSEEGWGHDHLFDYIHWRMMCTCFKDIKGMFTRIYDNLRPGGWAEFHDVVFEPVPADNLDPHDAAFVRNSTYARYFEELCEGGRAHGRDFRAPWYFREWMVAAGFVDVVKETIRVPLNGGGDKDGDQLGRRFCANLLRFLGGSAKLLEAGGMPRGAIPAFLDEVRASLTDVRLRGYTEHYVYYGHKPPAVAEGRLDDDGAPI